MPSEESRPTWGHRFRYGVRTYRAALSIFVLAVGAFLTVLALGYFSPLSQYWPFTVINTYTVTATDNWNLVFIVVGPIIAIIGAYFVGAYYVARRKFEHLMVTKSKAEFLRNIPEIEDLLWDLTPADETRYQAKRAELRLRH